MTVTLDEGDRARLAGEEGEALRLATRIVVKMAELAGADRLIEVTSAHVDGGLYHGRAGLDFAERLVAGGGQVAVPTTLNVGSLDLLHPELYRGDPETAGRARRLMECYQTMGCRPTWTCAPYQLPDRPSFGEQIAWAESNAIVFANSVLGARTNRYGDFLDICAALTGRVPDTGLHRTELRGGQVLFRLTGIPERLMAVDVFYPVLGHLVGRAAASLIPVLEGLPPAVTEDQLKALGAAAASSGAVALVHVVGVTPEAPTLDEALHGRPPQRTVEVSVDDLGRARRSLSTSAGDRLGAVSLGTPHFSVTEFAALVPLLEGPRPQVPVYVSTGRHVLEQVRQNGWLGPIERAGVQVVVDTCTYVTPIIPPLQDPVMTNSAKWAYYAPGNLGVEVVFGSLEECLRSAAAGRVVLSDWPAGD
ncbi:MAG: aconitase X [Acidimicrobiia bacterium]